MSLLHLLRTSGACCLSTLKQLHQPGPGHKILSGAPVTYRLARGLPSPATPGLEWTHLSHVSNRHMLSLWQWETGSAWEQCCRKDCVWHQEETAECAEAWREMFSADLRKWCGNRVRCDPEEDSNTSVFFKLGFSSSRCFHYLFFIMD